MDRLRARFFLLLIGGAALLLAAAPARLPILAAAWLDPGQRLDALTTRPPECAAVPSAAADRQRFEIGRAAFRAPLLIGGQAARAGLACDSCHRNGHGNPAFLFPGLSGMPGTADVTSSVMSSHRGNAVFDPRPIPDLAMPGKIARDPGSRALERFVHGLIVEEFDGPEPSPLILDGLAFYVRSLGARTCMGGSPEPVTVSALLDDASRALAAARHAWQRGDIAATRLLVSAARSTLGRIDERYAGDALADERRALRAADQALLGIARAIDRREPRIPARLAAWRTEMAHWRPSLVRAEPGSLFDRARLKGVLAQSAP